MSGPVGSFSKTQSMEVFKVQLSTLAFKTLLYVGRFSEVGAPKM
jgi:hypothetical protein